MGTYNEQVKDATGRVELRLMSIVHSVWHTFNGVEMRHWGSAERRAAALAEPIKPKPEPPTHRLDGLVRRLWPASWLLHRIVHELRGIDD